MILKNMKDMVKGWFVGNFEPSCYKTTQVEVGIKEHKAGDVESFHHHRIATEITVVVLGTVKMNGAVYTAGDIITLLPCEGSDFNAITDTKLVVVKLPGANNDKYPGKYNE